MQALDEAFCRAVCRLDHAQSAEIMPDIEERLF